MAIVKKVKGQWQITRVGLSDEEVEGLRRQLELSDLHGNWLVRVPFRVVYHQEEK
jgi:hypothetical protein